MRLEEVDKARKDAEARVRAMQGGEVVGPRETGDSGDAEERSVEAEVVLVGTKRRQR